MPSNVQLAGKYETYRATYQLKGGTLTAVREIEDHTAGPVCAPAVGAEYKKFATGVEKDLHTQLLYQ
jgi:hypothetical protein